MMRMQKQLSSRARKRGFTLIELLVVLAILTLLAGLVGPKVLNQLGGAKTKTAGVQIADIEKALELYKLDVGRYPHLAAGPGRAGQAAGRRCRLGGALPQGRRAQ